ncbi:hypothetical protein FDP41_012314 [Naegleria fowleri]|uniref:CRAL-TRIO domain-containing protein n=1 Tax=Naegleria fowleri TaxID=5763 RepID=A0A6A5BWL7_NAEFO|nr:uncharacterized protein FDP41_012314 [Naegleria fowleri]KAF0981657.1 hypothetical protein FDP41_012314 [Naegleria fowleri]
MAANLHELEEKLFGKIPQTPVPSVLDSLNDEKKKKIAEFRSRITNQWKEDELLHEHDKKENGNYFLSDLTLFRFLSGYQWNIDEVEPVLKGACEWRKKFEPWNVHIDDVKAVAQQGAIFHVGFDKAGHPLIYVKLGLDKLENNEENKLLKFKFFVWLYELAIRRMPENIYQTSWIVDLTDASLSVHLIKSMKDMFLELGTYYVERMAAIVVVNVPWSLKFLWGVVKMFLTQQTIDKYNIQGSLKEKRNECLTYTKDFQRRAHI